MTSSAARFEPGQSLPPYGVRAHNASTQSENKIHDDDVARQFGFAGGLVPGVTVFAYMTRPVVEAFGRDWLERGRMDARFLKPFYEGEQVTVEATVRETRADGPLLDLLAKGEDGEPRAVGSAEWLPAGVDRPSLEAFPSADRERPRPPASAEWFRSHEILGSWLDTWDAAETAEHYLDEIADDLALWRGDGAVAHPGWLIRKANSALVENVVLGPWIHVSSDVQYLGLVSDHQVLDTRSRVLDVFEKKGHKFVELDVAVFAEDGRPVMRARHTAIYEPRHVSG